MNVFLKKHGTYRVFCHSKRVFFENMVVQTTKNSGQEKRSEETEPGENIVEKLRGHC